MSTAFAFLTLLVGAISAEAFSGSWPPKRLDPTDNHILGMALKISLPGENSLEKRGDGGVYLCTESNWGAPCGYKQQPWNECIQLTDPYYQTISSIGPDEYNAIVAYSDFSCSSPNALTIFNPGYSDLARVHDSAGLGWDNRIGSFIVYQIPGPSCLKGSPGFPGTTCQNCCNGCSRNGMDCCPDGAQC